MYQRRCLAKDVQPLCQKLIVQGKTQYSVIPFQRTVSLWLTVKYVEHECMSCEDNTAACFISSFGVSFFIFLMYVLVFNFQLHVK